MNSLADVDATTFLGEEDGCFTPPYNPAGTPGARDAAWPERAGVTMCGAESTNPDAHIPTAPPLSAPTLNDTAKALIIGGVALGVIAGYLAYRRVRR